MTLTTSGGLQLNVGSGVAAQIQPPGSTRLIGNFQSYSASLYQAYLGMWSEFLPTIDQPVLAVSDLLVYSATFPAQTTISWDVTPSSSWGGVNGYLAVAYGNYDDSAGTITPKQVKNITTLQLNVNWTFSGTDTQSGLLSECWLTTTSHATGGTSPSDGGDAVAEVGFLPKVSPSAQSYVAGLPSVGGGSFTDSLGVTWNVKYDSSLTPTYYIAYLPSYASHQGVFDFKSYFTFLTTSSKITGNEYFNGAAFGVEPKSGAGSLLISSYTPTYS